MTKLAIRNIEHDPILDPRPIGLLREKNELRLPVDEVADQPRTSDSIDLNLLACDPFHRQAAKLNRLSLVPAIAFS